MSIIDKITARQEAAGDLTDDDPCAAGRREERKGEAKDSSTRPGPCATRPPRSDLERKT